MQQRCDRLRRPQPKDWRRHRIQWLSLRRQIWILLDAIERISNEAGSVGRQAPRIGPEGRTVESHPAFGHTASYYASLLF